MGQLMVDIAGLELSQEDKEFLRHPRIQGIILFARNYDTPQQLTHLITNLRHLRTDLIIAVDQEGGRVQRFQHGFTKLPSLQELGQRYTTDPAIGRAALRDAAQTMARELLAVGVDLSFAPVLDIDIGTSTVIGNRSFGNGPNIVTECGHMYIRALQETGMPAVVKHFPGHGGIAADSHIEMATDERDLEMLRQHDIQPFKTLLPHAKGVMTAHVVYAAVDNLPATMSHFWMQRMLREELGYDGAIITDDLCMQGAAVVDDIVDRAKLALEHGCDMALVCNDRSQAERVIDAISQQAPNPRILSRLQGLRATPHDQYA